VYLNDYDYSDYMSFILSIIGYDLIAGCRIKS